MENNDKQTLKSGSAGDNRDHGYKIYDLFIFVITVMSFIVIIIYYIPAIGNTETGIALALDNLFSIIFLLDFFHCLRKAPDRRAYFKKYGWLDLLGSIPGLIFLRVFRISRAVRILQKVKIKEAWTIYKKNQEESVLWTSVLVTILLLTLISLIIVQVESVSPNAQITTASDALWFSLVTTTTVGYGDLVPVTDLGRLLASILMTVGVAFVSVITSFITTHLILRGDPKEAERRRMLSQGVYDLGKRLDEIERILQDMNRSKTIKD